MIGERRGVSGTTASGRAGSSGRTVVAPLRPRPGIWVQCRVRRGGHGLRRITAALVEYGGGVGGKRWPSPGQALGKPDVVCFY